MAGEGRGVAWNVQEDSEPWRERTVAGVTDEAPTTRAAPPAGRVVSGHNRAAD